MAWDFQEDMEEGMERDKKASLLRKIHQTPVSSTLHTIHSVN